MAENAVVQIISCNISSYRDEFNTMIAACVDKPLQLWSLNLSLTQIRSIVISRSIIIKYTHTSLVWRMVPHSIYHYTAYVIRAIQKESR